MPLASPSPENPAKTRKFEVHVGDDYVAVLAPNETTDAPTARVYGDGTGDAVQIAQLFATSPDMLTELEKNEAILIALLQMADSPIAYAAYPKTLGLIRDDINVRLRSTQAVIAAARKTL